MSEEEKISPDSVDVVFRDEIVSSKNFFRLTPNDGSEKEKN